MAPLINGLKGSAVRGPGREPFPAPRLVTLSYGGLRELDADGFGASAALRDVDEYALPLVEAR